MSTSTTSITDSESTALWRPEPAAPPPVGSAAWADCQRPRARTLQGMRPATRHGVRRLLTVVALLPLIALLARQLPNFVRDPLVLAYGMSVLVSTIMVFYLAFTKYEDPSDPRFARVRGTTVLDRPSLPAFPRVSLLVAVMNEEDVIDRCVRSMVACDYPDLQVVVVDDCSTDGTLDRLRELQKELDFTLIALPHNVGKKHALVQGAAAADGEVIAFTDSDCVLATDGLRRCVAALVLDPGLGAVSGHARALNADHTLLTKVQDTWYEGSFRVSKAAESVFGSVTCVSGPLAVFRKDAIWNFLPAWQTDRFLGGEFRFATDRQLTGYVLGQKWVGRRLKDAHRDSPFLQVDYPERYWRVAYVQSARVWTNVPETMRAFTKQQVRWKKSFIRNLFFTGGFMWRRGPGPAFLYYGHALWVAAAPLMAVRHLLWAPAHGLWLLTLLYLGGVLVKGAAWGFAFHVDNPGSVRWRYRPLMSLISSVLLSWFLPYSLLTIRRGIWSRSL